MEVLSLVNNGAIGNLNLVEIQCSKQDIINAGIHLLNYFVNLTGREAMDYILATCESSSKTYRDGMQVETTAITYGQTRSGVRIVLHSGDKVLITRPGSGHLIRIVGSQGFIEFRKGDDYHTILNAEHPMGSDITPSSLKYDGHRKFLEDLADMIESGKTSYVIPDTSLSALELVEAAYLSSRYQCKVSFPFSDSKSPLRQFGILECHMMGKAA